MNSKDKLASIDIHCKNLYLYIDCNYYRLENQRLSLVLDIQANRDEHLCKFRNYIRAVYHMIPLILNFEFQINLIPLPIFRLLPNYGANRTLEKKILLACFYQSEKFGIREFKIG